MKAVIAILIPIIVTLLLRLVVGILNLILEILNLLFNNGRGNWAFNMDDVFDFSDLGDYWFFWLLAVILSLVAEVFFWAWAKEEDMF